MLTTDRFVPALVLSTGTHLRGYVDASYAELVKIFGEPNTPSDDYKVSTEWTIKDTATDDVWTLYDYKATDMYESDLPSVEEFRVQGSYAWHIGGRSNGAFDVFASFINEKLGRNAARCF